MKQESLKVRKVLGNSRSIGRSDLIESLETNWRGLYIS
jgi:hypothetical protein